MALFALTDAYFLAGTAWTGTAPGAGNPTPSGTITSTTALSDHLIQVEFDLAVNELDLTTFADGAWKVPGSGIASGSVKLTFLQDFAASKTDSWFGLGGTIAAPKSSFYLDMKPTSSARSATNPSYVASVLNIGWTPIMGNVGDRATVSVTWPTIGTVARLTS